jgi:hypothetical protein
LLSAKFNKRQSYGEKNLFSLGRIGGEQECSLKEANPLPPSPPKKNKSGKCICGPRLKKTT